jgi:hypothetical protein
MKQVTLDPVRIHIRDKLGDKVYYQASDQLPLHMWLTTTRQVWAKVSEQIYNQVRDKIAARVYDNES